MSQPDTFDPTVACAEARVGTVVRGKYTLERLIGVGGMAAVYAGRHRNGHRVALKFLHPTLAVDANLRARFLHEGYAANLVEHPGAVRVLDDDLAEDGSVFLVMELLTGCSVATWFDRLRGRITPSHAISIGVQLLDVLAAAHHRGVVHRDIKPDNLFLTDRGELKVLDFGIARVRSETPSRSTTRSGAIIGTPGFMAPEQAMGMRDRICARTDLWAVGATLYQLLTGRCVHEGTPEAVVVFTATLPVARLGTILTVDERLASVVDRALDQAPEKRWPDARSMQRALVEAHVAMTGAEPPAALPPVALGEEQATGMATTQVVQTEMTGSADPPVSASHRRNVWGVVAVAATLVLTLVAGGRAVRGLTAAGTTLTSGEGNTSLRVAPATPSQLASVAPAPLASADGSSIAEPPSRAATPTASATPKTKPRAAASSTTRSLRKSPPAETPTSTPPPAETDPFLRP